MNRVITIALKNRMVSKRKGYHRFFDGSNLSRTGNPHGLFLKFCRPISVRHLPRKFRHKDKASVNSASIPGLHLYKILINGGEGLVPGYRFAFAGAKRADQGYCDLSQRAMWTLFRVKGGIQRSAMPVERVADRQSRAPT